MEYENTNESAKQDTNISREEAVKKVIEDNQERQKYYFKNGGR